LRGATIQKPRPFFTSVFIWFFGVYWPLVNVSFTGGFFFSGNPRGLFAAKEHAAAYEQAEQEKGEQKHTMRFCGCFGRITTM
jgi:hypothetical protein